MLINKLRRFVVPAAAIFLFSFSLVSAAILKSGDVIDYDVNLEDNIVKYQYKGELLFKDNILSSNSEFITATTTRFYPMDQFYKEGNMWFQIEYATTTPELFVDTNIISWFNFIPRAIADTYFPSSDGRFGRSGTLLTWSDVHDGAGNFSDYTEDENQSPGLAYDTTGWSYIQRSPFNFDTSAIPDTDTVTACSLNIYGSSKANSLNMTSPGRDVGITTGDNTYAGSQGTTLLSSLITYDNWSSVAYNVFTCNASGISNISKTGTSYFVVRINTDIINTENVGDGLGYVAVGPFWSEKTGTDFDPYLDVTFSVPPPPPVVVGTSTVPIIDDPGKTIFISFVLFFLGIIFLNYIVFKK